MQNIMAVFSMALCVFLLIAAEFMPVSLLTPIAHTLHASDGMVGQAISVSGLFAVLASLLVGPLTGCLDRRMVLVGLTVCLGVSLGLMAAAQNLTLLMLARALLGIVIGAFWALSTAVVMRLVPEKEVPRALGVVYMGNAVAVAFAPPLGSWLGEVMGWRGVFWGLVPLAVCSAFWQLVSLPKLPPQGGASLKQSLGLLRRPSVAWGMGAVMLAFMGAFMMFTYFRPFLETVAHLRPSQLTFAFLALGIAAFGGTSAASHLAGHHVCRILRGVPVLLAIVSLCLLPAASVYVLLLGVLLLWGGLNAALPVAWSSWLACDVADAPEAGGGLMVAAIQLSIMLGASLGGMILDHFTFSVLVGVGVSLLLGSAVIVGSGARLRPS